MVILFLFQNSIIKSELFWFLGHFRCVFIVLAACLYVWSLYLSGVKICSTLLESQKICFDQLSCRVLKFFSQRVKISKIRNINNKQRSKVSRIRQSKNYCHIFAPLSLKITRISVIRNLPKLFLIYIFLVVRVLGFAGTHQ